MRDPQEVKEEIAKLKELEPLIRPYSSFGGDNRAKVRAEIRVLEEDLSEDEICNMEGIIDHDTLSIMLSTRYWLDGEEDTLPSKGREVLLQK